MINDALKVLEQLHKYARDNYIPILDDQCQSVLIELIKTHQPKQILEIGTAVGYSAALMALNCDCHIQTIDIDQDRVDIARKLWNNIGISDRIESIVANVDQCLDSVVKDKMYDFIFIDGPKSRYLEHMLICLPHLKSGGIILADDILFFGMVKGVVETPKKHRTIVRHLKEFLDYLEGNKQLYTEILEVGNGIAIITKK